MSSADDTTRFPFLFGTQYYRAPTPEPSRWERVPVPAGFAELLRIE